VPALTPTLSRKREREAVVAGRASEPVVAGRSLSPRAREPVVAGHSLSRWRERDRVRAARECASGRSRDGRSAPALTPSLSRKREREPVVAGRAREPVVAGRSLSRWRERDRVRAARGCAS